MNKAFSWTSGFYWTSKMNIGNDKRLLKYKNKVLALKWVYELTREMTNIQFSISKKNGI